MTHTYIHYTQTPYATQKQYRISFLNLSARRSDAHHESFQQRLFASDFIYTRREGSLSGTAIAEYFTTEINKKEQRQKQQQGEGCTYRSSLLEYLLLQIVPQPLHIFAPRANTLQNSFHNQCTDRYVQ